MMFHVTRHGQTIWQPGQDRVDPLLTELGREQALARGAAAVSTM